MPEPKSTTTTLEAAPKSIAAKLSEVLGAVAQVPKLGKNTAQDYRFARESDLVDMIRPMLAERKLFLHQSLLSQSREPLYQTRSGGTMVLTIIEVAFVWVDGETGEKSDPAVFPGYGADPGDKGIYKALTGAEKYFLMKTFLVSTGDDPEADEKVDKAAAAAEAAKGSRVASTRRPTATSQPGTTRGGRSSTATNPQLTEIGRLARELHLGVVELAAFIGKVEGSEATASLKGPELTEHLNKLDSDTIGKIIVALTDTLPDTDQAPEDDEDPFADPVDDQ